MRGALVWSRPSPHGRMLNLSRPFLERPKATALLVAGFFALGVGAYFQLPISSLPDVDFPTINVNAALPGASAETMASAVASPLERAFANIPYVTSMTSSNSLGQSQIVVQFQLDRDIDAASQDIQAAISAAAGQLPKDMPNPPSYKKANPNDIVEVVNLFHRNLPQFDGPRIQGKFNILSQQVSSSEEEKKAWKEITDIIDHFKSFDAYIFAVPMWNFGIPYILKQYIDIIVQPTLTFSYSATGYQGLVTGKPVVAIYARGGVYGETSPVDFQKSYLEMVLKFIGFTDIQTIFVEGQMNPQVQKTNEDAALESATALGSKWNH